MPSSELTATARPKPLHTSSVDINQPNAELHARRLYVRRDAPVSVVLFQQLIVAPDVSAKDLIGLQHHKHVDPGHDSHQLFQI